MFLVVYKQICAYLDIQMQQTYSFNQDNELKAQCNYLNIY